MVTLPTHDAERRICQRTQLQRSMLIKTSSGRTIQGTTLDVSLGGILLDTRSDLSHLAPDQRVSLFIVMQDQSLSQGFPCVVRRIEDDKLGLQVNRKSAPAFGKALTKGMLAKTT